MKVDMCPNAINSIEAKDMVYWPVIDRSLAGQMHFSSKYRSSSDNKFDVCSSLTKVAVSDDGNVWGVNRQQNIYRWLGSTWQHIAGKAIQVR